MATPLCCFKVKSTGKHQHGFGAMTDDEQLQRADMALYGHVGWKPGLARDLGVSERNVARWAAGERPIPVGVWGELGLLLVKHAAACELLADDAYVAASASTSNE
jgi:hypothetical protein